MLYVRSAYCSFTNKKNNGSFVVVGALEIFKGNEIYTNIGLGEKGHI